MAGVVGDDSLIYHLVDQDGRRSVPATYRLTVTSALTAIPLPTSAVAPIATEGTLSALTLQAVDLSPTPRSWSVVILTPPTLGALYQASDTSGLHPMRANGVVTSGMTVLYRGPSHYFSSPAVDAFGQQLPFAPDNFTYKVVTTDGGESLPVVQHVHIRNVNSPTQLAFEYPVGAAEIVVHSKDQPKGGTSNAVSTKISGFVATDPDRGADLMHVALITQGGGTVTLNKQFLGRLDYNSAKYCKSTATWACQGDGTSSRMSFVTTPDELQKALNGLTFTFFESTSEDTISVMVYDGQVTPRSACLVFYLMVWNQLVRVYAV